MFSFPNPQRDLQVCIGTLCGNDPVDNILAIRRARREFIISVSEDKFRETFSKWETDKTNRSSFRVQCSFERHLSFTIGHWSLVIFSQPVSYD